MNKKIFLIITIFLVGFFIPKIVFAETYEWDPAIYVQDANGEHDVLAGDEVENITYDEDIKTLTLHNFNGKSIYAGAMDLTVVLEGENSIKNYSDMGLGVEFGTLTIKGSGSLTIEKDEVNGMGLGGYGKLIIESGTINIRNVEKGVFIVGDFEMNGGTLNIENCSRGIYFQYSTEDLVDLEDNGFSTDLLFAANGGTISIKDCNNGGIGLGKAFKLNGSKIHVTNYRQGIISGEAVLDSLVFIKGEIVLNTDDDDSGVYAFGVSYGKDSPIEFNATDLYISDDEFDFQRVDVGSDERIALVIAKEGTTMENAMDGEHIARNISILPKEQYEIKEGNKQKIVEKTGRIVIDADINDFIELYINDELVDEENYDLEEGSTIITLKDEYVKGLEVGSYTFKAVFNKGKAEGTFEVVEEEEETTKDPETGDGVIYSILLLMMSTGGLLFRKRLCK